MQAVFHKQTILQLIRNLAKELSKITQRKWSKCEKAQGCKEYVKKQVLLLALRSELWICTRIFEETM